MELALSLTLFSTFSTRARKPAMASSISARRLSAASIDVWFSSARRCSVTSSWVATQPPSGIGRLASAMKRPSCSRTLVMVLPLAMLLSRSAMYWSMSPEKLPIRMRCSSSSRSDAPGRVTSGVRLYICT